MGSFAEMVFAVELRPDVPDGVLASLAAARTGEGGPALPEPVPSDSNWWPDEPERPNDDPLTHQWGDVFGTEMCGYFPGEARATLIWDQFANRWKLTGRCSWKTDTQTLSTFIEWLAPYVCEWASEEEPQFVGYIKHEYDDRPTLIWHVGDRFHFEGIEHAGGD